MPLQLICGDITTVRADAIVNAANTELAQGGGVCGAIFERAGAEQMRHACARIGHVNTGEAVITPAFRLHARYVIHTAGPVWQGGDGGEEALLSECYRNSLALARQNGCASVAFPLISAGIYGYPKERALSAAVSAIRDDLLINDELSVLLVLLDTPKDVLDRRRFSAIERYVDDRGAPPDSIVNTVNDADACMQSQAVMTVYQQARPQEKKRLRAPQACMPEADSMPTPADKRRLSDVVEQVKETFSERLLRLIDERSKTDVEVYKRANLDRKLFSKIRSNPQYRPSKPTAVALAVALELNLDEARDLLQKAGYALSDCSRADLIVQYFIETGNYDIFEINEALFAFGEELLGA